MKTASSKFLEGLDHDRADHGPYQWRASGALACAMDGVALRPEVELS